MKLKGIYFIALTASWLSYACTQKAQEQDIVKHYVKEWTTRQIKFPPEMTFLRFGIDTVPFDIQGRSHKILIYIDSSGCTTCKLQLDRWKEMMAYTDSVLPGGVSYIFAFDKIKLNQIRSLLKQSGMEIPVYIDNESRLMKLNDFPDNSNFQTFLLDENNQVEVIGNPIYVPEIKELYIKTMLGAEPSKSLEAKQTTTAVINADQYNIGTIKLGESKDFLLELSNTGGKPLVIADIVSSCGCVTSEYSKEPVKPGGKVDIHFRYDAKDAGYFNKTIKIYANISKPIVLTIQGVVYSPDNKERR